MQELVFGETAYTLSKRGIAVVRSGASVVRANADWLRVITKAGEATPGWREDADALAGVLPGLDVCVRLENDSGSVLEWPRVKIQLRNLATQPLALNLKWALELVAGGERVRWLIPGLFYRDNRQEGYTGLPSIIGEPNLAEMRSPWWTFRSDLAAVPMVMAWTRAGAAAMVVPERMVGAMTSVGLDARSERAALVGSWPYREEPRIRAQQPEYPTSKTGAHIEFATLKPGEDVEIAFWLYVVAANPYAFSPVLRETFSRWDALHASRPWFGALEGQSHAAYGLFTWHYDPEVPAIWETAWFDGVAADNPRRVHRYDMHVGFVSGTPAAYALRSYGLRHGREDMAEAGRKVLDFCCRNLTPYGTFHGKYNRELGWTTGWSAQKRLTAEMWAGAPSVELQARTLADATLFAARAAREESHEESRRLWSEAVRQNLEFVTRMQRADGNCGQAYAYADGEVLDWEGDEGLFWIAALVEGSRLLGCESFLAAACRAGSYYAAGVREAYLTGAPEGTHLLPTSEDPQNAVIAYTLLWEASGERQWLELARLSAELLMTFRWQYNTVFPPRTMLAAYDYRTKGMDVSSPNNVHLHPYGLVATPELVRLYEETGDLYLLKQARNHLLGCHQMLAARDGCMDAPRGMMSERWYQTPNGTPKGETLRLSHAWALALVLYADLFVEQHGQLFYDAAAQELVVLDAVSCRKEGDGRWSLRNETLEPIPLSVAGRQVKGEAVLRANGTPLCRGAAALSLDPGETVHVQALRPIAAPVR